MSVASNRPNKNNDSGYMIQIKMPASETEKHCCSVSTLVTLHLRYLFIPNIVYAKT